jgi:hypothetical protein
MAMDTFYSCLSAINGSTRVARRAGKNAVENDFRSDVGEITGRQWGLREFFNHGQEIGKGSDLRQGRFGGVPADAAS